jgi:membrane protease YdiL (CAAX protease family)
MEAPTARPRAILIYFLLAFLLSWGAVVLLAGPARFPIDPAESSEVLPLLYVSMLLGPSLAGLFLTGWVDGRAGFRRFWARLSRWRVSWRWYALALLLAPVLALLILGMLSVFSGQFTPGLLDPGQAGELLVAGLSAGIMVGFFEELGWSGFVIPRLRQRYSIMATGLLVGLLWGAWHFILFWEGDSFAGWLPFAILLGRLFLWLPPYRIYMVWLLERTDSLLLTMLSHVSLVFTVTALVPMALSGLPLLVWLLAWGVGLWGLVVFLRRKMEQPSAGS